MSTRRERLKKLVKVQQQLTALHETRHAGFLAAAAHAETEARELVERFDTPGSLAGLFPQLYHSRIAGALSRKDENLDLASTEAALVARATARTNRVERTYRDILGEHERQIADRERLDLIANARKPATGK